jgi:hypothetical protein
VQRAVSLGAKDIGKRPTRFPIGLISHELRECHAKATTEGVVGQVSDGPRADRNRDHVARPAVSARAGSLDVAFPLRDCASAAH